MKYIDVTFDQLPTNSREVLIALLAELGFEGFDETGDTLQAFIPADQFDQQAVSAIADQMNADFAVAEVAETNWNEVWESNFEPVQVDDFCTTRADFHNMPVKSAYDIIITPKMSFGTGHHATTYMMIRQMSAIDMRNKRVFDFGTGTGVLAILADKMGAAEVLAVDIDEWSIANAQENIARNQCSNIRLELASHADGRQQFDVILANITRNVILDNFEPLQKSLVDGGILLLSGLLRDDEAAIQSRSGAAGFQLIQRLERDKWLSLRYRKNG